MKVHQLIEELKKLDQNLFVYIPKIENDEFAGEYKFIDFAEEETMIIEQGKMDIDCVLFK